MRTVRLVALAAAAATALVPLTATGAFAAPPNNDKPAGAVALTLGQTINENTTQATTGTLDAKLNQLCGAPYTNASVWFTYTPTTSGTFQVDMSASDYTGGFMIFVGKADQRNMRSCGPETLAKNGVAGRKYIIMAFSDTTTKGGNLKLSLEQGPPPPTVNASLDSTGKAYKSGNALVSGTLNCTNAEFVSVQGTLTQIWKRLKIQGHFQRLIDGSACNGADQAWQKIAKSDNGLFAAGDATANLVVRACGELKCAGIRLTDQPVTLTGPGGKAITGVMSAKPTIVKTMTDRPALTWKTAQSGLSHQG